MTETNKAAAFIESHSKLNEAGTARSVNQTDYLEYMRDQHAVTPEQVKAVAAGDKAVVTGAMEVATGDLEKLMKEAKKRGDDPTECSASVRISRPSGPITTTVLAERITTNPSTGAKSTHHGVVGVKVRAKTMIDQDAAKKTEERISKLLGK